MAISLKELLKDVVGVVASDGVNQTASILVSEMTLDSRAVKAGYVFVALRGTQVHGLNYAKTAEQSGAVAVLWEYEENVDMPELSIPTIAIKELPASLGGIAARLYDYSSQDLQIVGITGTDGKTSVSHFLAQAMNASNELCSVIGTLGIGSPKSLEKATHTTPDVISVHRNLHRLSTRGSRCVAMEVSSHALDQQRVAAVDFDVAVLTNLTRDHLDYHGTVEAYADAKMRLFVEHQPKAVVVNLNDAFGVRISETLQQSSLDNGPSVYRYAIAEDGLDAKNHSAKTILATNAQFNHLGLSADIGFQGETYHLQAGVLADFNLSNLLAAIGTLIALGTEPAEAVAMVSKVETVPGRIEKVTVLNDEEAGFLTVVDYAHTAGALESVLKALQAHCTGRLICVFGCGGDRDKGKRPLMAATAERLADVVIVTDDNPRFEDTKQIMRGILSGFDQPENVLVQHDRAKAIREAVGMASNGDVVLVAGKGHEKFQLVQGKELPFDDRQEIRGALTELAGRAVA